MTKAPTHPSFPVWIWASYVSRKQKKREREREEVDGNKAPHANMPYVFNTHILPGLTRLHSLRLSVGRKGQVCGNLFSCNFTCSVGWPWFFFSFLLFKWELERGKNRKRETERESDAWMNTGFVHLSHVDLIWSCPLGDGVQIAGVGQDFFLLHFKLHSSVTVRSVPTGEMGTCQQLAKCPIYFRINSGNLRDIVAD